MTETQEAMPTALFTEVGHGVYLPSEFTRGPWRPDAQHGGPPSALLLFLSEALVEDGEFLSHVEIELLKPVPLARLQTEVTRTTMSRRVHRITATLASENDVPVARANALVLACTDLPEPDWTPEVQPAASPPPADAAADPPRWASGGGTTYHRNAVEHRFTVGDFRAPGPAVDWQRLRLDVVSGHTPTGLQRLGASADFGSGVSAVYAADSPVGLINANLAISLHREPVGEWISLDATTHVGPQGTGLGITRLGDVRGELGIASQSLLGYQV